MKSAILGAVAALVFLSHQEPEQETEVSANLVNIYGKYLNKAKLQVTVNGETLELDNIQVGYITNEAKAFQPYSLCR